MSLRLALAGLLLQASAASAACGVDVKPLAFGTIDVTETSEATGEVVVDCDEGASFSVAIDATGGKGRMTAASGGLAYELYQNAGRSIPWGSGSLERPSQASAGSPARLTIYGLIPRQPSTPPGSYLDQLTVTLSF